MATLKIRKTKITNRGVDYQTVAHWTDRGKTIKDKVLRKEETALHKAYIEERQSMRKAQNFKKWIEFIEQHEIK